MAVPNPDEMEEFQKLSDQYRPELEGPLVGDKLPLTELATEYAQADPTYVAKTQALANSYDAYRRVKGDGQCGWRGTVFGYFEILLKSGDLGLVLQEHTRIQSYSEMMKSVGIDYDIISDMFDHTFELFEEIRKLHESGSTDEAILMKTFNEDNVSDSIVYHFKMMTSAYMAANEDDFAPFLEMPLHEYRQTRIDPPQQEIDQIGLQGLTNGVLAPGCIAVEVLYLDRSAGEEVTPYNFAPHITACATVRLLYRPGHYDIIYKPGPLYQQAPITAFVTQVPDWSYGHVDPTSAMIQAALPNSHLVPGDIVFHHQPNDHGRSHNNHYHHQHSSEPYYMNPMFPSVRVYDQSHVAHEILPRFAQHDHQDYSQQHQQHQQQYLTTMPPSSMPISPTPSPLPGAQSPVASASPVHQSTGSNSGPAIRCNPHMWELSRRRQHSIPLDPNTSASFAQNRNYYRNSDFEPECWSPEDEYNK